MQNKLQCNAHTVTQNAKVGQNPIVVGTVVLQALDSNDDRLEVIIQNVGTTVIFIGFGFAPTPSNYSLALNACASGNDGNGGVWISDIWKGPVYILSAAPLGAVALSEMVS